MRTIGPNGIDTSGVQLQRPPTTSVDVSGALKDCVVGVFLPMANQQSVQRRDQAGDSIKRSSFDPDSRWDGLAMTQCSNYISVPDR